jgi:hypothetical protein
VRNLERAGGPRSAVMKMVGHKTEAMYRRYAIADESILREGAVKLETLLAARRQRGESRAANTFRASAGSSGSRAPMISTVSPARVSLCTHSMTAPWSAA